MNVNQLIKRIKNELGLSRFLKLSYTDHDLYDIIVEHTMPEWSRYFKYEMEFNNVFFTTEGKVGPDLYEIPKAITDKIKKANLEIMDLKDYRFGYYGSTSGFGSFVANYEMDLGLSELYTATHNTLRYANNDINTQALLGCFYEKPNKLRFVFSDVVVAGFTCSLTFNLSQSPNLFAVSPTREHDFFQLAKLNTMIVLYQNEGKYIENLASGAGNVNLRIEDWQQAGDKKEEFLKELLKFSHIHEAPNQLR